MIARLIAVVWFVLVSVFAAWCTVVNDKTLPERMTTLSMEFSAVMLLVAVKITSKP